MNTKQMEYIIKIAKTESISKAAEELFISQSALNQQLLKLEKELDTKFFIRAKQSLIITPAGSIYVSYAKKILALKKEAYTMISDLAHRVSGTFSVGLTPDRGIEMFMAVYPDFYRKYPNVTVVPTEIKVRRQLEMLKDEELDLGFITLAKEELPAGVFVSKHIATEHFVAAIPAEHSIVRNLREQHANTISLSAFHSTPFVLMFEDSTQRSIIDPLFERAGFKPNIILQTASNHTLIKMVESGLCCSILPEYYASPNSKVSFFRLDPDVTWEFLACYKRGKYVSTAVKNFIVMASKFWRERHAAKMKLAEVSALYGPAAGSKI